VSGEKNQQTGGWIRLERKSKVEVRGTFDRRDHSNSGLREARERKSNRIGTAFLERGKTHQSRTSLREGT